MFLKLLKKIFELPTEKEIKEWEEGVTNGTRMFLDI